MNRHCTLRRHAPPASFVIAIALVLSVASPGRAQAPPEPIPADPAAAGSELPGPAPFDQHLYTNADWLLDTYFTDAEGKRTASNETTRMLANGFALLIALGRNPQPAIDTFVASMNRAKHADPSTMSMPKFASQPANAETYELQPVTDPPFLRRRAAIRRIADYYKLPYKIDNSDVQWFIAPPDLDPLVELLTPEEFMGESLGSQNLGAPANWLDKVRPADVIWASGTWIAKLVGHAGIISYPHFRAFRRDTGPWMIDANTDGVRNRLDLNAWSRPYAETIPLSPPLSWDGAIEMVRPSIWESWICRYPGGYAKTCQDQGTLTRLSIVNWASAQVGKPYSFEYYMPTRTDAFYCTSLIWHAYGAVDINPYQPRNIAPHDIIFPHYLLESTYFRRI